MIAPNTPFKYTRLDKNDAALLLVDHQACLISLVQDFEPSEFKNNVLAAASLTPPNHRMQETAFRAVADAERWAV